MTAPAKVALEDQIAELRRELVTRKRVYPRWIEQGHIDPDLAAKRLAALEAALATLRRLDSPELPL